MSWNTARHSVLGGKEMVVQRLSQLLVLMGFDSPKLARGSSRGDFVQYSALSA